MGVNILDNGDAVGSGDNGGHGRPSFGPGPRHGVVEIVKHHGENVSLGAEALAEQELVDAVLSRLDEEGINAQQVEIDRDGRNLVLRGVVASDEVARIAEIVASGTPGVMSVLNQLQVDASIK